jgi:hypothetical protein
MVVLFAASILSGSASFQTAMDTMREQIRASARPGMDLNQIMEVVRSPTGILFGLLGAFLLLTAAPFGGAGAKLLNREAGSRRGALHILDLGVCETLSLA